jgi:hypothetical protein
MSANAAQEKPPLVLICATIVFYTVRLQHARNEAPREAAARTCAIQQIHREPLRRWRQIGWPRLGGENPAVAQELNNLGAIGINRGNYPASEAYYCRALALIQTRYGPIAQRPRPHCE